MSFSEARLCFSEARLSEKRQDRRAPDPRLSFSEARPSAKRQDRRAFDLRLSRFEERLSGKRVRRSGKRPDRRAFDPRLTFPRPRVSGEPSAMSSSDPACPGRARTRAGAVPPRPLRLCVASSLRPFPPTPSVERSTAHWGNVLLLWASSHRNHHARRDLHRPCARRARNAILRGRRIIPSYASRTHPILDQANRRTRGHGFGRRVGRLRRRTARSLPISRLFRHDAGRRRLH